MVEYIMNFYHLDDRFSSIINPDETNYFYVGYCWQTRIKLTLPRNKLVEAIACQLMEELPPDREGKMYGVLLVENRQNERGFIKAFSGLLDGNSTVNGWVGNIDKNQEDVLLAEAHTLQELAELKQELVRLNNIPERSQYQDILTEYGNRLTDLNQYHQQRKQKRQQQRTLATNNLTEAALNLQSQLDGIERKKLKKERDRLLQPLKEIIIQSDRQIQEIKQRRKALSGQLQRQMHQNHLLLNFLGQSASISQIMPSESIPSGTGDCCAPKLLHYAAQHQLKPLAMAEFWWGQSTGDKIAGEFYGACQERCQPLMGFLLSGLNTVNSNINTSNYELPIIYEDDDLIAVNKPSGLLSVPGRYHHRQDSVLTRISQQFPNQEISIIHRLDRDTSGIMILAKNSFSYQNLTRQWQEKTVKKVYQALLEGIMEPPWSGIIDLPLWGDPQDRPKQSVNWEKGKPSQTEYRVIGVEKNLTRMEFVPITGRTHQIRVHSLVGLGKVILGDRLYGSKYHDHRLHLHAQKLTFIHPRSLNLIDLSTDTPF
jgi:tRNA pseudouridine32 synthase/23S rRNA pseudouridine746 synthase